MSTPGYPDWTAPVGFQEQADTLVNGQIINTFTGQTPTLDVSQYQSVVINDFASNGSAGDLFAVVAAWSEPGGLAVDDTLTSYSPASLAGGFGPAAMVLPVRARQLVVVVTSDAGTRPHQLYVVGSTRPAATRACNGIYSSGRPILKDVAGVNLPANNTDTYYLAAVNRAYALMVTTASNKFSLNLRAAGLYNSGIDQLNFARYNNIASPFVLPELVMPFTGLRVDVTNNDASAFTYSLGAMDVS